MSGNLITLAVVGAIALGGWYLYTNSDILNFLKPGAVPQNSSLAASAAPLVPTVDTPVPAARTLSKRNKKGIDNTNITGATGAAGGDNSLGPKNWGDEGPDLGYGFSKSGGPVGPNGRAKDGSPRVGNNKVPGLTVADLPGPCETVLYKGMIQYRHAGLSASSDTCTHAKQYYLYKYGVGGGTSKSTTPKSKGKKSKYTAAFASADLDQEMDMYDGKFHYLESSPISILYSKY